MSPLMVPGKTSKCPSGRGAGAYYVGTPLCHCSSAECPV